MKTVATANCPTRYYSDHDLIHESDLTLNIENVESIDAVLTFVSSGRTNALVTAGAECPAAVFRRWSLSSDKHNPNILALMTKNQRFPKLIYGLWGKGVTYLRTVERNTRHAIKLLKCDFLVFLDGLPF